MSGELQTRASTCGSLLNDPLRWCNPALNQRRIIIIFVRQSTSMSAWVLFGTRAVAPSVVSKNWAQGAADRTLSHELSVDAGEWGERKAQSSQNWTALRCNGFSANTFVCTMHGTHFLTTTLADAVMCALRPAALALSIKDTVWTPGAGLFIWLLVL